MINIIVNTVDIDNNIDRVRSAISRQIIGNIGMQWKKEIYLSIFCNYVDYLHISRVKQIFTVITLHVI